MEENLRMEKILKRGTLGLCLLLLMALKSSVIYADNYQVRPVREMCTEFWKESQKENSYLDNLVIDESIIWKFILKTARVWSGPKYVTIESS